MKKIVELPLIEPMYGTYHYQGPATATLAQNPSIKNWYLNQVLILYCTHEFLNGFSSPKLGIIDSSWNANPYIGKLFYNARLLNGCINRLIRNLIDEGCYVCFRGVDDYYIPGKSWYKELHFFHDGCICGYNQTDKTYCMYAYDSNWIYQKFWIPQRSFVRGSQAILNGELDGEIWGIKPCSQNIEFSAALAIEKIKEYLNSSMEKYPETAGGEIRGIIVQNYLAKYIDKLYDSSIPYEKMDKRILRLIWEHKKVMYERILKIEDQLSLDNFTSKQYHLVVKEADTARALYAMHGLKPHNNILPSIKNKLLNILSEENRLLTVLIEKAERRNIKCDYGTT